MKESDICKELAKKIFLCYINMYEFVRGLIYFTSNLTGDDSKRMFTSSTQDFYNKINNVSENVKEAFVENCNEIIDEKFREMSTN